MSSEQGSFDREGLRDLIRFVDLLEELEDFEGPLADCSIAGVGEPPQAEKETYDSRIEPLMRVLWESPLYRPFDTTDFYEEALRYSEDRSRYARADLDTLSKITTFWLRSDRFIEGNFAEFCRNGDMKAILERVATLIDIST